MPYLDETGTKELWSKIKSNFAHDITASSLTSSGITISLNSGMKNSGNWTQLATANIPAATNTAGGLVTDAQAKAIASIQTYTAGTNISISGGQISVTGLAKVATTGKYSDLTGIDTSMSSTSTNAVSNAAISTALSGKAEKSHKHTQSDISDFPTSLKNPNALTIGDVSYDGETAKSITAGDNVTISNGKISAKDTTYSAATTSTSGLMSALDKTKLDLLENNVFIATYNTTLYDNVLDACNSGQVVFVSVGQNVFGENTPACILPLVCYDGYYFYFGAIVDTNDLPNCLFVTSLNSSGWGTPYTQLMATRDIVNDYAPLYSPDFTGTVTVRNMTGYAGTINLRNSTYVYVPEPSSAKCATNKSYVDTAIETAVTGVASYGGTVASQTELLKKTYKKGNYYVVSVPSGSTWTGYENGDMFFAKQDKSGDTGSLDDFDVVQANITAMTEQDIKDICTLD